MKDYTITIDFTIESEHDDLNSNELMKISERIAQWVFFHNDVLEKGNDPIFPQAIKSAAHKGEVK